MPYTIEAKIEALLEGELPMTLELFQDVDDDGQVTSEHIEMFRDNTIGGDEYFAEGTAEEARAEIQARPYSVSPTAEQLLDCALEASRMLREEGDIEWFSQESISSCVDHAVGGYLACGDEGVRSWGTWGDQGW